MPRCAGNKRDGGRCTVIVAPPDTYCYQHDPSRSEERKRNASKGGKSRGAPSEIADLKAQLKDLADGVLKSKIERADAVVVNQILNTRARLIELERKVKETDQLEARLEALESVLKGRNTA